MEKGMIIATVGKARSGKDQFATYLAEELFNKTGKRFIMVSFAHDIKIRLQRDFDLSYDQLWGDEKEIEDHRYPKPSGGYWTPRELMQFMGESFRQIDIDFWVNNLFRIIEEKEFSNVIITDVRHDNEAKAVINKHGYLFRVNRESNLRSAIHNSSHISETSLDNFSDYFMTIDNNFGLKELDTAAKFAAESLLCFNENRRI